MKVVVMYYDRIVDVPDNFFELPVNDRNMLTPNEDVVPFYSHVRKATDEEIEDGSTQRDREAGRG
jgi:hypothetical protein